MDNKQLDKFHIGFEFEFMIKSNLVDITLPTQLKKVLSEEFLNEYRPYINLKKPQLKDYYNYFIGQMTQHFPGRNWEELCKAAEDGSIHDDDKYRGLEIVVQYQKGVDAIGILREICTVLSLPQFKTNNTCGLHANVSYTESAIEEVAELSYYLSQKIDNNKIAQRFNRKNNEYCLPNLNTALDREEFNEALYESILQLSNKKLKTWGEIKLSDWQEVEQKLKQQTSFDAFIALARKSILKKLENEWIENRPAIAPKTLKKVNYIEFRTMGGADYQKKLPEIEQSLEEMLIAMQSYQVEKKQAQKKKKAM
jgi:hypothetical protein